MQVQLIASNYSNGATWTDSSGNGNQVLGSEGAGTVSFTAAPTLGMAPDGSNDFNIIGEIAEFRFYSGSMTTGERDVIYNSLNSTYIIPVPEPSAFLLLGVSAMSLLMRRQRR